MSEVYYLISDLHEVHENIDSFVDYLAVKDEEFTIINAGDYAENWHVSPDVLIGKYRKIFDKFSDFNVISVHGNHDPDREFKKAVSIYDNIHYIHDSRYTQDNYVFVGYGGVEKPNPTKSRSGSPKSYKQIYNGLKDGIESSLAEGTDNSDIFLVVHHPARNYLDTVAGGRIHIGSYAVKDVAEKYLPGFIVAGHVHEDKGIKIAVIDNDKIKSLYLNRLEDGHTEFYGISIEKYGNHYDITYNKAEVDMATFLNPGSLGYNGDFIRLEVDDTGSQRHILIDMLQV